MQSYWSIPIEDLLKSLNSDSERGLEKRYIRDRKPSRFIWQESPFAKDVALFIRQYKNPMVLLLLFAVILSYTMKEFGNATVIFIVLFLSGILSFIQERKANRATEKLNRLVHIKTTVIRRGESITIPMEKIMLGDVILVNAGDIIPGDAVLLSAQDLYVNQSALTGESFPAEKNVIANLPVDTSIINRTNVLYEGSSVISGNGKALVVTTGKDTEFGKIRKSMMGVAKETAFELGIKRFGYFLLRIAFVLSVLIFILNIFLGKPVASSIIFSLAFAVGLAPELLPGIVTVTLSSGASRMAKKKVIVKKLAAIQNLGEMEVFCSDKTGTLTEGVVEVHSCTDHEGTPFEKVREYGYLNAFFESGYTNPIDEAIINSLSFDIHAFSKCDEVPYDFMRKRLSIVVSIGNKKILICKGAVRNVLEVCSKLENTSGEILEMKAEQPEILSNYESLSKEGYRVLGIAWKDVTDDPVINKDDETELIFLGFISLYDPPKKGIVRSMEEMRQLGISLKLVTGDNRWVASKIGKEIGLSENVLCGDEITGLTDDVLMKRIRNTDIFAEIVPSEKVRIVKAFQQSGMAVGFMGDGINDAAAIQAADVGISINNAVDVAKEAADIVLMKNDLSVLREGVLEGRRTFTNTLKYIYITISANLGNMVSVAFAALFLPFLPLLPIQILLINFITDIPMLAISSDNVDPDQLEKPRKWDLKMIKKFMLVFGLESSFFDIITFILLYQVLHLAPEVFRTGWFVESVISEVFILLIIRTRGPFYKSKVGIWLLLVSILTVLATFLLPYIPGPFKDTFEFVPLSPGLMGLILVVIFTYIFFGEITKRMLYRKLKF